MPDAHHPISHHQRDPAKLAKLTKINQYHVQLFSQFLERLGSTPDGDGTLLDHSMIVYRRPAWPTATPTPRRTCRSCWREEEPETGGRHIRYPENTPLANLHVTLLDKLGVPVEALGHATGKLRLDPLAAV